MWRRSVCLHKILHHAGDKTSKKHKMLWCAETNKTAKLSDVKPENKGGKRGTGFC